MPRRFKVDNARVGRRDYSESEGLVVCGFVTLGTEVGPRAPPSRFTSWEWVSHRTDRVPLQAAGADLYGRGVVMTPLARKLEKVREGTGANRGRRFERWLAELLDADGLEPRTSYRPKGEEIDGSFLWHGSTTLLEAKWTTKPIPASELYRFKGKVDGKLIGTIGVFFSMGGYSRDAVDALTAGKSVNVILFAPGDVELAATAGVSAVLATKLRAAAEEGVALFPVTEASLSARGRSVEQPAATAEIPDLAVVVEGETDARIVRLLAERILSEAKRPRTYDVIPANGILSLTGVTLALQRALPSTRIVVILDDDDAAQISLSDLEEDPSIEVIRADPGVHDWAPWSPGRRVKSRRIGEVPALIKDADLADLLTRSPGLARLAEILQSNVED